MSASKPHELSFSQGMGYGILSCGVLMKFSCLNGKCIALIMDVQGQEIVLRGSISLAMDTRENPVLQVAVSDDDGAAVGAPVFLIAEKRWRHRLASGVEYGCDYMLDLSRSSVKAGRTS